jgi:hypothetical protein
VDMQQEVQILLRAFGVGETAPALAPMPEPARTAPEPAPAPAVAILLGAGQETADRALADLSNMYRNLQLQAGRVLTLFGSNAPCEVINRHFAAVEDYVAAAGNIFQQLTAQGFTVVQKLYNLQGQQVGEQKGPTPVRPAYFEPCKGGSGINGFGFGRFAGQPHFGRTVLNLGMVPNSADLGAFPLVAVVIIALVAGGTAVAVTHTIMVNLPSQPVAQVQAQGVWMDNYLTCVERKLKTDPKLAHDKADALCRGLTKPPEPPKPALPMDPTTLIVGVSVLALLAIGGAYAYREYKRRQGTLAPPSPAPPQLAPMPAQTAGLFWDAGDDGGAQLAALDGRDDQAYSMGCPCL